MSNGFSDDEVKAFESVFSRQTTWHSWRRRRAEDGRDVLEVITEERSRRHPVRLTKIDRPRSYMAAGLKGWSLVVCASFDELMSTVANRSSEGVRL